MHEWSCRPFLSWKRFQHSLLPSVPGDVRGLPSRTAVLSFRACSCRDLSRKGTLCLALVGAEGLDCVDSANPSSQSASARTGGAARYGVRKVDSLLMMRLLLEQLGRAVVAKGPRPSFCSSPSRHAAGTALPSSLCLVHHLTGKQTANGVKQ